MPSPAFMYVWGAGRRNTSYCEKIRDKKRRVCHVEKYYIKHKHIVMTLKKKNLM
jgi:hypothetical protein